MARPLRIEFAGARYQVTSRGDGRENIYLEKEDRDLWLDVLGHICERFNWVSHVYCQMGNHYHDLLIETPDGNLATGMRQLNGVYTQRFNQMHNRVGRLSIWSHFGLSPAVVDSPPDPNRRATRNRPSASAPVQ